MIGPIAQLIFIPFMTTGAGVALLGPWFGVGADRGMALLFTLAGAVGLAVTLLAMRSHAYRALSAHYQEQPLVEEAEEGGLLAAALEPEG
jgi:DHA3 family multidrug efflux protein-like MFS transporter